MDLARIADALESSQRILILGPSGAGKTRLALQLGRLLKIELVHLDFYFWKPGWVATPQDVWRETVEWLAQKEKWIMDGTYESTLDMRIPRADLVILVEDHRWNCLFRALRRRVWNDRTTRPDAPPGQRLDGAFLRYIWKYSRVTRPIVMEKLNRYGPGKPTVTLRGQKDIQKLVHELETRIRGHGT